MITIKTDHEISKMRDAGKIAAEVLQLGGSLVKPGVSTKEIDDQIYKFIKKHNAVPSFLNYYGYPASACISINEEVIHGIPSGKRVIADGDIVSIDVGVLLNGYHADTARTFGAGNISEEAKKLIEVTKECFGKGLLSLSRGKDSGISATLSRATLTRMGFRWWRILWGMVWEHIYMRIRMSRITEERGKD